MADTAPRRRTPRHSWALVSLITGVLLTPVAFATSQAVGLVTNTDRVAGALEPLIETPEVQAALVSRLTDPLEEFFTSEALIQKIIDSANVGVTVPPVLDQALTDLLQPVIDNTLAELREALGGVFRSESFAKSWRQIVADAHVDFRATVFGPTSQEGGSPALTLSLQPFLVDAKNYLVTEGFDFLEGLILPDVTIEVVGPDTMDGIISSYRVIDALDPWLTVFAFALIGGGVIFSSSRATAWALAGGGVALSMVVSVIALWVLRTLVIPARFERSPEVATLVTDALLAWPITSAITVGVVAATIGVAGWAIEARISRQKAMT